MTDEPLGLLPNDLREFILRGNQLQYDEDQSEVGMVEIVSAETIGRYLFSMDCWDTEIQDDDPHQDEEGCYLVEGIDLIANSNGDYGSEGLLMKHLVGGIKGGGG